MKPAKLYAIIAAIAALTFLRTPGATVSAQVQWALDTVLTTGAYSSGIAITPDGGKAIVTLNTIPGSVKVITISGYAISTIDLSSVEGYPNAVAVTPDGMTALVATTHKIAVIDLSTGSIRGTFTAPCAGTTLYGIAVSADGQSAFFPDLSSSCTGQGLRSISTATPSGSSFAPLNTSGELYAITITADGASAIVTTFTSDAPKKVNLSTSAVQSIPGFSGSYSVAALHRTGEALIQGDSLKRVSLTGNAVTRVLSDIYSTALQGIAITADDRYAFVVGSFQKVVVDLTANTVIQTFSAGGTGVAAMPDGARFFVTDSYNGTTRVYKRTAVAGVPEQDREVEIPRRPTLSQNFPNPFNPSTVIRYTLPDRSHVTLSIFNTLGQLLATPVNADVDAGIHEVHFNARNLTSGVYFYRLSATPTASRDLLPPASSSSDGGNGRDGEAGSFVEVKRCLIMK